MRDVHDAHQPVLQVQAHRHQRIDAAGNEATGTSSAQEVSDTVLFPGGFTGVQLCGGTVLGPHHLEIAALPLAHGARDGGVLAALEARTLRVHGVGHDPSTPTHAVPCASCLLPYCHPAK